MSWPQHYSGVPLDRGDWNLVIDNLTGSQIKTGSLALTGNLTLSGNLTQQNSTLTLQNSGIVPFASTASYIIFNGSVPGLTGPYYALNGNTNKIDYNGANAATVIQTALNALTSGRTWKEKVILKGDFNIDTSISLPAYSILEVLGSLKATSSITGLIRTNGPDSEIYGRFDLNNTATKGVYIQHSRLKGDIRCDNIGANSVGLHFEVTNDNNGCYWNQIHYLGFGLARVAGSYGVRFTIAGGVTATPNLNYLSGQVSNCDVGVSIESGIDQIFTHFDASACNTNWDIYTVGNFLIDCYSETGVNYGVRVRNAASIILQGGEIPLLTVEGIGTVTNLPRPQQGGLILQAAYPNRTPKLNFTVSGNGIPQFNSDGVLLYFRDGDNNIDRMTFNKTTGDLTLLTGSLIINSGSSIQNFNSRATNPTTSDIPAGRWLIWKNTATGTVYHYYNDGGTLKSGSLT